MTAIARRLWPLGRWKNHVHAVIPFKASTKQVLPSRMCSSTPCDS